MQAVIGYAVLALVLIGSAIGAYSFVKEQGEGVVERIFGFILALAILVALCYIVLGLIGGFFWVILWIGVLIRECLLWLVEAVIYPLRALMP